MRKIMILLSLIALIFIGNFVLWFLNTRAVSQGLEQLKRELLHHSVQLSYDEIKFTNFKSWRVEGIIQKVNLVYGKYNSSTVKLHNIKFQIFPFAKQIILSAQDTIEMLSPDIRKNIGHFYLIPHSEGLPRVVINLESSLKEAIDILRNPEAPKLHLIDGLVYEDSGFNCYDVNKSARYFEVGPTQLQMNSKLSKYKRRFDFDYNVKHLVFDPTYPEVAELQELYNHHKKLGNINIGIKFTYLEAPSKVLMTLIEQDKENKKQYKNIFDSYQIDVTKVSQTTDIFDMELSGFIDRQPGMFIPDIDLNVKINKYQDFTLHAMGVYNTMVEQVSQLPGVPPLRKLQSTDLLKVRKLLAGERYMEVTQDIPIVNRKGMELSVAGKPFMLFLQEAQGIFLEQKKVK